MRLIGKQLLEEFSERHADARGWIENWIADVEGSIWQTPQELKSKYPKASLLAGNVVIFDVRGNDYRLETIIAYRNALVQAIWAGTHAQYDKRNKQLRGKRK